VIEKVEGIVLRTIKYSDNSFIIQLFTRERGRISCIAKGLRSKSSKFSPSFFHPFFVINAEIFYNPKKEIHPIKEVNLKNSLNRLREDHSKLAVAMFLAEVLNRTVRYQNTDEDLYDFLENMIYKLDIEENSSANFHIYFLLGLSHFLGFYPVNNYSPTTKYFDLLNANFVEFQSGSQTINAELSEILKNFMTIENEAFWKIPLNSLQRRKFIGVLLNYYTLHTGTNMDVKSLEVLTEVFS
jgi:DNA repair protein RecO (recombination protein O)